MTKSATVERGRFFLVVLSKPSIRAVSCSPRVLSQTIIVLIPADHHDQSFRTTSRQKDRLLLCDATEANVPPQQQFNISRIIKTEGTTSRDVNDVRMYTANGERKERNSSENLFLQRWVDMPRHLQFNPHIRTGYRPLMTVRQCIGSLFYIHNETVNIMTHGKHSDLSTSNLLVILKGTFISYLRNELLLCACFHLFIATRKMMHKTIQKKKIKKMIYKK